MVETTARVLIIASLTLMAIIAGGFAVMAPFVDTEATPYTQYNNTLNKFDDINSRALQLRDPIDDPPPKSGALGILDSLIEGTLGVFRQMWDTLDALTSFISDVNEGALGFPIPQWLTGWMIAVITAGLAFALMAAWFKWRI